MRVNGSDSGDMHRTAYRQRADNVRGHEKKLRQTDSMEALRFIEKKSENSNSYDDRGDREEQKIQWQTTAKAGLWIKWLLRAGLRIADRIWNGKSKENHLGNPGSLPSGQGDADVLPGSIAAGPDNDCAESAQKRQAEVNPVLITFRGEKGSDTLWQRFKIKVYAITGYLAESFGREKSLQTGVRKERKENGQEHPKNVIGDRRHEKREGVPADNSHLGDSYDRGGKYVRLGRGTPRVNVRK